MSQSGDTSQKNEQSTRQARVYAQTGQTIRVYKVDGGVEMNTISDGKRSAKASIPSVVPKGVSHLYVNDGNVLEAVTINGSLKLNHTTGRPREK